MSDSYTFASKCLGALALFMTVAGPQLATADENDQIAVSPETVGKRIAIAGRQRMLAESMAKSTCYAQSEVDAKGSLQNLYVTWNVYGWYHQGIYFGNPQLELFPETDKRVIRRWQEADKTWVRVSPIGQAAWQGQTLSPSQFETFMDQTGEMSELNNLLVSELRARYGDKIAASGGQMSALLIDLYERQRMLGQKLSKEVCLIARDFQTEEMRASLGTTISTFSNSLDAFITGMPGLNIPPAPTPEIKDRLVTAKSHWTAITEVAQATETGGQISREDLVRFREEMDLFLSDMTMAINLLVAHEAAK
ncbi:hypothetical protein [Halovulum sp. GXIMD14793]